MFLTSLNFCYQGFCDQNLNLHATHAQRSEHHSVQPTLEHFGSWRGIADMVHAPLHDRVANAQEFCDACFHVVLLCKQFLQCTERSKCWHVDSVKNHEKTAKTHSDFGGLQSANARFLLFV